MSPSLPPPPRKSSSSSTSSAGGTSYRYPKINPNTLNSITDPSLLDQNDNDDLDQALAQLLGQTNISGSQYPYHQYQSQGHQTSLHHPQCKHYRTGGAGSGARPLSITSVSSLGSGSYSSYGSSHSRRISQAPLSPLSPSLSDPTGSCLSGSYFGTLNEDDENKPSVDDGECHGDTASTLDNTSNIFDQSMALAASSFPSCTYCPSVRSDSICSSGTQEEQHAHRANNGHRHRDSIHQLHDNNRLAILKEYVPSEVRNRLSYHLDECWFLHFSPSGQYMASTGLDHSIILWQDIVTPEPTIVKTFQFPRTITHVEWSPDSKYILVNLGFDAYRPVFATEFHLVDVAAGEIVLTRKHRDGARDIPASGIGWMTDSERFVTGTSDGLIYVWNLQGIVVQEVDVGDDKTLDRLIMIPGQNAAAIVTNLSRVEIISLDGGETRYVDTMADKPATMAISPNGSYLSVSMKSDADLCRPAQIFVYDFQTLKFIRVLEADSYVNDRFIIMPMFCGPHGEILCAGSENGMLNFWDVETGEQIMILEEHSKHSGWVAFHPTMPGLMASCSDDNHIILWVTKDLSRALQDEDEKWIETHREEPTLPSIDIKKG
ncbi:hypothetical protein BGX27_002255, partial [Mortierella sp. AM989]